MVRMERHKCKLCSRSFSSGRALGGHMRSHLANLPLPPKTPQKQEISHQLGGDSTESTSSEGSLEEEVEVKEGSAEEKGLLYGLRENPKKSFRLVDPQFLDGGSVVVQDRESETESTRKPTRRRSKRTRRMVVAKVGGEEKMMKKPSSTDSLLELEQVSSISDTSPEEDLALCLIMLSRDVWYSSTNSDDSEELKQLMSSNKVIASSQAFNLRAHKSHKKIKITSSEENEEETAGESELEPRNACSIKNLADKKVHECPFCGKVFGSGQALGGHKRSHFLGSSTTTAATATTASVSKLLRASSNSAKSQQKLLMIDLNLPAPVEDEDENDHHGIEDSCIQEVSAVSDADFINPIKH